MPKLEEIASEMTNKIRSNTQEIDREKVNELYQKIITSTKSSSSINDTRVIEEALRLFIGEKLKAGLSEVGLSESEERANKSASRFAENIKGFELDSSSEIKPRLLDRSSDKDKIEKLVYNTIKTLEDNNQIFNIVKRNHPIVPQTLTEDGAPLKKAGGLYFAIASNVVGVLARKFDVNSSKLPDSHNFGASHKTSKEVTNILILNVLTPLRYGYRGSPGASSSLDRPPTSTAVTEANSLQQQPLLER